MRTRLSTLLLSTAALGCQQQLLLPSEADFDAPSGLTLVCLHKVDVGSPTGTICPEDLDSSGAPLSSASQFETVALESCNLLNVDDFDTTENPTGTALPNSFLFTLVANSNRSDVAVVSLSTSSEPQVIDSDDSVPGISFLPVGAFPTVLAADPGSKRFVSANTGSGTLSIFENTDLIRCFSNRARPSELSLGGTPKDVVVDENGIAYVTLPNQGELLAVDLRAAEPLVVARLDLQELTASPMKPTRLALSRSRRVVYVSNAAGTAIAEVGVEALLAGTPTVQFIELGSRTGAIAYLEPGELSFTGTLPEGAELPTPIAIPETLYVASLEQTGQVLLIDAEARTLVNLRPSDPLGLGPGIRVGGAVEVLDPIVDIRFFTEPLLPIVGDPEDPNFVARQDQPNNLQGAFALVTTNDAASFVINIAAVDPARRCCAVDGDAATCNGTNTPTEDDGTCREGVFLPSQSAHTVRNTLLVDQPSIDLEPSLLSGQVLLDLNSSAAQRFPAIGNGDGCLGGEGECTLDPTADVKIQLPDRSEGLFAEFWTLNFEGVIPGSFRLGGLLTSDSLQDNASFCTLGVEVGDYLQIVSELRDDAPVECANLKVPASVAPNGAFNALGSSFDEIVSAELVVTEVRDGEVFVAPRPDAVNPPADLTACFEGAVSYRVRIHDAFLVSGSEPSHNFLHRQITNPDGSCAVDGAIDPRFSARAELGQIFENIVFRLEITNPEAPQNAQGVVASFRDTLWQFSVNPAFAPWAIDPDISRQTGNSNIAGGVVMAPDGSTAFVSDINLDRVYELEILKKQANPNFIN